MATADTGSTEPAEDEHPAQTVEEVAESEGSAAIDLDVLAVADDRKLAMLVADILDDAVARGASRIHLLPYKNDFFLVFRVDGASREGLERPAFDAGRAHRRVQELRKARQRRRRHAGARAGFTPRSAASSWS